MSHHKKEKQKSKQCQWKFPTGLAKKLVDFFFHGGKWFLLIADYSKFPTVHLLPSLASKDVFSAASSSISVFGFPDEIISDNDSQFVAKEYHDLAARYGFKVTISSPHYSWGHCFIERQVHATKKVGWRWLRPRPGLDAAKSHSIWQQDTIIRCSTAKQAAEDNPAFNYQTCIQQWSCQDLTPV